MNPLKFGTIFAAAAALTLLAQARDAAAQTRPSYRINPFQDEADEAADSQPQGSGSVADAAAQLFGPEQAQVVATPTSAGPWQDLNTVDPNGQTMNYKDTTSMKVDSVVKAPLPKKRAFSDPLDDFKKDQETQALFGPKGRPLNLKKGIERRSHATD